MSRNINKIKHAGKSAQYEMVPFTQDYLEPAVDIFLKSYRKEQEHNPMLPSRAINEPEWIIDSLKRFLKNPGVAVLHNERLIAYMIQGFLFSFKGQNAVQVPVFCHGSIPVGRKELYRRMYMYLGEGWAKNRRHVHIISHFAHDSALQETLYQLGFGAFDVESVRDFSMVSEKNEAEIIEEKDYKKLADIHSEYHRYYAESPIFISKNTDKEAVLADLRTHADDGDVFLVYYEQNKPCAYFIVGAVGSGTEGFLLKKTNSAQVEAAYTKPQSRGKGIGKALLQRAVDWSREHRYERLFVEHETANYHGGNFWSKHFSPYQYFSLRYIDNTINY